MSALYNYFVVTTWQYGKNQHATVVRAPLGESFLSTSVLQYWTGKRWDRRERFAHKFSPRGKAAARAMHRAALLSAGGRSNA